MAEAAGLSVPVSEFFGPTFQGEGPHAGRRCWFLRLGLCNLHCEWCDTPYTWDSTRFDVKAENPVRQVADLAFDVAGDTPSSALIVISGGAPLMHRPQIVELVSLLRPREFHVETNGTIIPPPWWHDRIRHTTVSPKVNTVDAESKRIKLGALHAWSDFAHAGLACFKFVVRDGNDMAAVDRLVEKADLPRGSVWIMPEGTTSAAVLDRHRTLATAILSRGYNTTTRLHTLLWGDERGH